MKSKKTFSPPRLAVRLLNLYAGNAFIEDMQGDLDEMYYASLTRMSPFRARANYWWQVILVIVSYALKKRKQHATPHVYSVHTLNPSMIKSYLKISYRHLLKSKSYAIVNITGLAIAVAVIIVLTTFIRNEVSYDLFHIKHDRIFRVDFEVKYGSNHAHMASTPAMAARALQDEFPEIESGVRLVNYGTYLVKSETIQESIKENQVLWTDSTFFRIFSVKVVEGDSKTTLAQPYHIAISQRTAEKYFQGKSALGNTLLLDNKYLCHVTAVFENMPDHSHFHADILIPMLGDWPIAKSSRSTVFSSNNFNSYLLLKEGADVTALQGKLPAFLTKYRGEHGKGDFARLSLTPIADIHLHSNLRGELEPNGSVLYVYLFSVVAVLVLIIACINFINLATAQSGARAKEIGLRKVVGSQRSQIVGQFLMEAILITSGAVVIGVMIAYVTLPLFNSIFGKHLLLPFDHLSFYVILAAGSLALGLLAGSYPAIIISRMKPVKVLKGQTTLPGGLGILRNGLVVIQFSISIFLIVAAITIRQQLQFIQNKKLGFEKDQIMMVKDVYALRPHVKAFKNEVNKIPGIARNTITGFIPVEGNSEFPRSDRTFWRSGTEPTTDNLVNIQTWRTDADYIATFQMNVIKGRDFSDNPVDSTAVILNESAVEQFGLGDDPIGMKINTFGGDKVPDFNKPQPFTVIGVVEDFHFSSLKENITPLGLFLGKSDGFLSVRFQGDPAPVIEELQKCWKRMAPGQPFQMSFLDHEFEKMYMNEQRLSKMFNLFAGLAIVIACFGLFAMTAYSSRLRTKEIGIRKVLGASVRSILLLLSLSVTRLLVLSFAISVPVAWYCIQWWLTQFSYRTEIGFPVYVLAGGIVFLIAWITMWHHAYRAASTDPVKAIKTD